MATTTPNYGLVKPALTDNVDISVLNANSDTLDAHTHASLALLQEHVSVVAASGSTQTLPDVTADTMTLITLTAACTLTFPTAAAGKSFRLGLKQDGSGSRTVTWPSSATVRWPAGVTPTLTTTINKTDYFFFVCMDGTHWDGLTVGQNY